MNTFAKGQIISVNVGAVREIVYRGRPRTTAIWKEPVAERLPVLAEQVSGDHQADPTVHGGPAKAVYSYASEDYAWWSEELGETLAPGTFGENLTTAGIDLNDLLIGQHMRAGLPSWRSPPRGSPAGSWVFGWGRRSFPGGSWRPPGRAPTSRSSSRATSVPVTPSCRRPGPPTR